MSCGIRRIVNGCAVHQVMARREVNEPRTIRHRRNIRPTKGARNHAGLTQFTQSSALPRLFTKFYRAENVGQLHIDGLGIGLLISQEIMRLHGRDIQVTSQEGKGSTFTMRLPLAAQLRSKIVA